MTTILVWVVPKPHSDKLCLVVDHSAGDFSPNLYILSDEAGVHLDTLHVLGKALLMVKQEQGNVPHVLSRQMFLRHIGDYRSIPCGSFVKSSLFETAITLTTTTALAIGVLAGCG
jgi:hypothetical protein